MKLKFNNFDDLLDVRRVLQTELPQEAIYGFTPDAGLPLGFVGCQ